MTHRCHISVRYSHKKSCTFVESKQHIELSRKGCESESELDQTDFFLYVMDVSYFSGKMEMYCRYKGLNFMRVEPTFLELKQIGSEIGVMQVPILYDNRADIPDEKRWLRDTTPMIEYLESILPYVVSGRKHMSNPITTIKKPPPPVIPSEPALNFMTFLLGMCLIDISAFGSSISVILLPYLTHSSHI